MKYKFFFLLFLVEVQAVNACICNTDPLSAEVLNRYSFIFVAKVTSLKDLHLTDQSFPNYQQAGIEPLEYFKGSISAKTILVSGVRSSCDMGVAVGDTWVFFANLYNGQISIFPCGHSVQYLQRETDYGYDGFMYSSGLSTLNFLRNQFIRYPQKAVYTGKWLNQKTAYTADWKEGKLNGFLTLYDEEGRKIARYAYKDSLLEGESIVWYKNGQVYSRAYYKRGLAVGVREEYASSGRLLSRYDYVNGERNGSAMRWDIFGNIIFDGQFKNEKMVDTIRSWYPVDTSRRYLTITTVLEYGAKFPEDTIYAWNQRRQLENMSVFDDSERISYQVSFYRNGKLRSLLVTEPNTGYKIRHEYFINGITREYAVFYYVWNKEKGYNEIRTIYSEIKFDDQSDRYRKSFYNKEGDKVEKVLELIDGKEVIIFPKQKQ
jgi:antitoxin component YwqK of YwqJK toxin-antitoxin module